MGAWFAITSRKSGYGRSNWPRWTEGRLRGEVRSVITPKNGFGIGSFSFLETASLYHNLPEKPTGPPIFRRARGLNLKRVVALRCR